MEQLEASTHQGLDHQLPSFNLPAKILCKVMNVQLRAEQETDEVYAQITLLPEADQSEVTSPDSPVPEPQRCNVHSFCKTLTASDTSTHGGFSVLRRHADDCLPPLDMSQQPPWQELVATDLHGNEWHFRHIFREFCSVNPFRLIGVGLSVWTFAAAGCGVSFDFWSITICRMLVGVGEASFISLAAPFIDDNAPVAQVPDASSGHQALRESVGDDNIPSRFASPSTPPPASPRPNEQDFVEVSLLGVGLPKLEVAEGLLISMDPLSEVDGIPVGQIFYRIFVENVRKPNAHLERPRKGIATVGESVGRHVAWKSIDVILKELAAIIHFWD